jgi:hypothetical protein
MKSFLLMIFIVAAQANASEFAECQLRSGIFQNSEKDLRIIRFETLTEVFTLANAKTLYLNLDGEEMRFYRSEIDINRQTKITYLLRKKSKVVRAAYVHIDRTPKVALLKKEFYGNIQITHEIPEGGGARDIAHLNPLTYNFYCRF